MSDQSVVATGVTEILAERCREHKRKKKDEELRRLQSNFSISFKWMAEVCYPELPYNNFADLTKDQLLELEGVFMKKIDRYRFWHHISRTGRRAIKDYLAERKALHELLGDDWFPFNRF